MIKRLTTPNAGEDLEQQKLSILSWWECKMMQPPWNTVWQFPIKLNIHLPIALFGIYPKELELISTHKLKHGCFISPYS